MDPRRAILATAERLASMRIGRVVAVVILRRSKRWHVVTGNRNNLEPFRLVKEWT